MSMTPRYLKQNKIFYFTTFFLISSIVFVKPVHAYAGPGVAIGAIIVFITVVITFFASFFIKLFNLMKSGFKLLLKSTKNKKSKIKKKR